MIVRNYRRFAVAKSIVLGGGVFALMIAGCGGESTDDKMMRMARARSAANKANEAAMLAKKAEKSQPLPEVTEESEQDVGHKNVEAVLVSRKDQRVETSEGKPTAKTSSDAESSDESRPPEGPYSKQRADVVSPPLNKLLVARSGEVVVYCDEDGAIVVYDALHDLVKRRYRANGFTPISIAYSDQQKLVVLGDENGTVKLFRADALDGVDRFQRKRILLQEQQREFSPYASPVDALAIRSSDGMLMACDAAGQIRWWDSDRQPASGATLETGQQGVTRLFFVADHHAIAGTSAGEIKLWNLAQPEQAPRTLVGPADGRLVDLSLSRDGQRIAAVFDDEKRRTLVWELSQLADESSDQELSRIDPIVAIESEQPCSSGMIHPDGTHLLIGGTNGTCNLWTIATKKHIARFERHATPVVGVGISDDRLHIVTVGSDTFVRSWRFPEPNDPSDKRVPLGKSFASAMLSQLKDADVEPIVESNDPMDRVRQHLIDEAADLTDGAIFDLFPVDERARSSAKDELGLLRRMESFVRRAGKATTQQLAAIAKTKRRFFDARSRLVADVEMANQRSFSDGHKNLIFAAETDFDFHGTPFRPVKLTIAKDRYVYAARRSNPIARDNTGFGSVASWDFGYSGVKMHDWDNVGLDVQELYASPDGRAVFTVPDLFVFSHDGHSHPIASGAQWAVSHRNAMADDYLFAVGTQGSVRKQEVILRLYDGRKILADTASPVGGFSAYEGVVTAVAFAKQHRRIAFCVRERASYRLYVADPTAMDPSTFVLVDEEHFELPYLVDYQDGERNQRVLGPPGITSLEFSPNDELLVAHGFYEQKKYRLSMWQLDWRQRDTRTSSAGQQAVRVQKTYDPWIPDRGPVLQEHGSKSIHFIHRKSVDRNQESMSLRMGASSTSSGDVVVIEALTGLQVVNLRTRKVLREVPFVATQWGRPEYHITEDGRWVIMGDDNGTIDIFDLIDGKKISLTIDGRPAHAGPVVGVSLSHPDPALGFPAYAATVGEENQIKVWDLILPMTTAEASTTLPKPFIETRESKRKSR